MGIPNRETLIAEAVAETGLSDFGDCWFFANIDALIPALNRQAQLNEAGQYGARSMIVSSLVKRLRHVELIKKNPEILNEQVDVAAILTGLPRTGSTMLHRMLAAAPELTAVRWYEAQNYVPLPDEPRGDPSKRIQAAETILAYMLDAIPELMSIHPMSTTQPDEEVIILGQLFSSAMIESTYYVPDYAAWLSEQDPRPAYEDLIQILQSLQWQNISRRGQKWVLKTPGHLMALDVVLSCFPKAKIIMTHRDPVATVPSYCSMEASLYKLGTDKISPIMIGTFWLERLHKWLSYFMKVRDDLGHDRFLDIHYKALLDHPIEMGERVLEFSGLHMGADMKAGMSGWIAANKREDRATHKYNLDDFGLSAEQIQDKYKAYITRYLAS